MKAIYSILFIVVLSISCDSNEEVPCDSNSPNRTGAICNDGTKSTSVGSGTCSGHGGVDYWLCN